MNVEHSDSELSSRDNPAFCSIGELAKALARNDLSSTELVGIFLQRTGRFGPKLHAYAQVFGDAARLAAQAADKARSGGQHLGPLHGIPIAIKDIFDYVGHPTEAGSAL